MSLQFSEIGNKIYANATWAASNATSLAKQSYTTGRQFVTTIKPTLSNLVARIQSIDVSNYVTIGRAFLKTDAGLAVGFTALALACCIVSKYKQENFAWQTAFVASGVAFLSLAAGYATNTSWLKLSFLKV